jgi:hypothetical protein
MIIRYPEFSLIKSNSRLLEVKNANPEYSLPSRNSSHTGVANRVYAPVLREIIPELNAGRPAPRTGAQRLFGHAAYREFRAEMSKFGAVFPAGLVKNRQPL